MDINNGILLCFSHTTFVSGSIQGNHVLATNLPISYSGKDTYNGVCCGGWANGGPWHGPHLAPRNASSVNFNGWASSASIMTVNSYITIGY